MKRFRNGLVAFAAVGLLTVLVGVGAAAYFLGGFYSVAARAEDPQLVNAALIQVRTASIERHADTAQSPPSLDDPNLIRAGALAYSQRGCIACHGAPGIKPAGFSEGLNPPPNLKKVIKELPPEQVFWVLQNGIKMSGMPSFGDGKTPLTPEENWSIVAFVKKMGGVSPQDFKAWSGG